MSRPPFPASVAESVGRAGTRPSIGRTDPGSGPHVLREYALLADGERGALIGPRGEVARLCAPRWLGALRTRTARPGGRRHHNLRRLEYFIDHTRMESELFTGWPTAADGMLTPDTTTAGHGMALAATAEQHRR